MQWEALPLAPVVRFELLQKCDVSCLALVREVLRRAALDLALDSCGVYLLAEGRVRHYFFEDPTVRRPLGEEREQVPHAVAQLCVGLRHGVDDARQLAMRVSSKSNGGRSAKNARVSASNFSVSSSSGANG